MSININRETLCGLSNSYRTSPFVIDARTIGPIFDSLLSAMNRTNQSATLYFGTKLEAKNT